jgi:hypothetical protein
MDDEEDDQYPYTTFFSTRGSSRRASGKQYHSLKSRMQAQASQRPNRRSPAAEPSAPPQLPAPTMATTVSQNGTNPISASRPGTAGRSTSSGKKKDVSRILC